VKRSFRIKAKPFSINAATYGDARTKTSAYYEWSNQIFHQLWSESNQQKMRDLREFFDETKHSVKVHMKAVYPKDQFITKQGTLSARTIDCSNGEKLLLDLFFDKQFFSKPHPTGVPNININDKHVVALYSEKTFHDSDDHKIEFTVKIVARKF
jgi:hypothetical protein